MSNYRSKVIISRDKYENSNGHIIKDMCRELLDKMSVEELKEIFNITIIDPRDIRKIDPKMLSEFLYHREIEHMQNSGDIFIEVSKEIFNLSDYTVTTKAQYMDGRALKNCIPMVGRDGVYLIPKNK